jgi:AcrR family transcriptional regulator
MTDAEFDQSLVAAAFALGAREGWSRVSAAAAAREAGLDLAAARRRFPSRASILIAFGAFADQFALEGATQEGPVKDRLFDLLMRRLDALQARRAGVQALLRAVPADPGAATLLLCASRRSMRWMLEGAGVPVHGLLGALRVKGLLAVWLYAVRAWAKDTSADLAATMRALDEALGRAEQLASYLPGAPPSSFGPPPATSEASPIAGAAARSPGPADDPDLPEADETTPVDEL